MQDFERLTGIKSGELPPDGLPRFDAKFDAKEGMLGGDKWDLMETSLEEINSGLTEVLERVIPSKLEMMLGLNDLGWRFVDLEGSYNMIFLGVPKDLAGADNITQRDGVLASIEVRRRTMGGNNVPVFMDTLGISGLTDEDNPKVVSIEYALHGDYRSQPYQYFLDGLQVSMFRDDLGSWNREEGRALNMGTINYEYYFSHGLYYLVPSLVTPAMLKKAEQGGKLPDMAIKIEGFESPVEDFEDPVLFFEEYTPNTRGVGFFKNRNFNVRATGEDVVLYMPSQSGGWLGRFPRYLQEA